MLQIKIQCENKPHHFSIFLKILSFNSICAFERKCRFIPNLEVKVTAYQLNRALPVEQNLK